MSLYNQNVLLSMLFEKNFYFFANLIDFLFIKFPYCGLREKNFPANKGKRGKFLLATYYNYISYGEGVEEEGGMGARMGARWWAWAQTEARWWEARTPPCCPCKGKWRTALVRRKGFSSSALRAPSPKGKARGRSHGLGRGLRRGGGFGRRLRRGGGKRVIPKPHKGLSVSPHTKSALW